MASPTTRSKKALADDGWHPEKTEHWNHYTQRRHDLFGFVDFIGFDTDLTGAATPCGSAHPTGCPMELHCVLIQVTDSTSHSKHRKKILASQRAREIEERGFPESLRVELISWRKKGGVYVARVEAMRPLVRTVLRQEALAGLGLQVSADVADELSE